VGAARTDVVSYHLCGFDVIFRFQHRVRLGVVRIVRAAHVHSHEVCCISAGGGDQPIPLGSGRSLKVGRQAQRADNPFTMMVEVKRRLKISPKCQVGSARGGQGLLKAVRLSCAKSEFSMHILPAALIRLAVCESATVASSKCRGRSHACEMK
jgi:hypothetical protein